LLSKAWHSFLTLGEVEASMRAIQSDACYGAPSLTVATMDFVTTLKAQSTGFLVIADGTVRVFGRNLHSRMPLDPTHVREANTRVTNGIPLGCPLLLLVCTVNSVQTLKVSQLQWLGPLPHPQPSQEW
jgi:hypothetical protein